MVYLFVGAGPRACPSFFDGQKGITLLFGFREVMMIVFFGGLL